MKFTIVVTVFDYEFLVPRVIHSLDSQTYQDWEVHFLADGPHRAAQEVVRRYAKRCDHRVTWTTGDRTVGTYGNHLRRQGLQDAQGDYVCFIGHDCLIGPDYLATHQEQIAKADDPVLSVVGCDFWSDRQRGTQKKVGISQHFGVLPREDSEPKDWSLGSVDLTSLAFPTPQAKTSDVFGLEFDRIYAADWKSFEACRKIATPVFNPKVVCAHF